MSLKRLLVVVLGALSALSGAQLTQQERKGIEDVLFVGNLKPEDLKFERKTFKDVWRFPLIDQCVSDPLGSSDQLMALHESARLGSIFEQLNRVLLQVYQSEVPVGPSAVGPEFAGGASIPAGLRPVISELVSRMQSTDLQIKTALGKLSVGEQRELIEGLPVWAVEEPKIRFEFVKQRAIPQSRILELLKKVNVKQILVSGALLTSETQRLFKIIQVGKFDVSAPTKLLVNGLPVLICGTGNDRHTETDVRLTIDLGGHNFYGGRHGAGVGYTSVLLDVSGDSSFDVKDLSIGAGVLGVGIALIRTRK